MLIVTRKRDSAQVRVICEALHGTVAVVVWTDGPRKATAYKVPVCGDYRVTEAGRFWLDHHRRKRLVCGHYVPSVDSSRAKCTACRQALTGAVPRCALGKRGYHKWQAADGHDVCALCGAQRKGGCGFGQEFRHTADEQWRRVYGRKRKGE